MAAIRQDFTTAPPIVPNFDAVEFTTGKGLVEFVLGKTVDKNILSSKTFYADPIFTLGTATVNNGPLQVLDVDFDVRFLRTAIIDGEATVNVPLIFSVANADTFSFFTTITIRTWDGSTETDLVSNVSTTFPLVTGAGVSRHIAMATVDLTIPKTIINLGTNLRITIAVSGSGGGVQWEAGFAADPKGRTINTLANYESWAGAVGEIDFTSIANGTAITIANAFIPFQIT